MIIFLSYTTQVKKKKAFKKSETDKEAFWDEEKVWFKLMKQIEPKYSCGSRETPWP